jgi:hypothetical protein
MTTIPPAMEVSFSLLRRFDLYQPPPLPQTDHRYNRHSLPPRNATRKQTCDNGQAATHNMPQRTAGVMSVDGAARRDTLIPRASLRDGPLYVQSTNIIIIIIIDLARRFLKMFWAERLMEASHERGIGSEWEKRIECARQLIEIYITSILDDLSALYGLTSELLVM